MSKRTCFVVSPIGDENSEFRKNADDVFDLIITPAVEKFGFTVIRADKIPGPGSITEEIIRLVQESELCIIDLTYHNPNVFYECGRRHETGRPFIQIIRKDEKIPFDLAGIRTIKYSLTDAREIRAVVLTVQSFLEEVEKGGYAARSSGATLVGLHESIQRIERKLERITGGSTGFTSVSDAVGGSGISGLFENPQRRFQEALIRGDLPTIIALLPQLEVVFGPGPSLAMAATPAAINGNAVGARILSKILEDHPETLDAAQTKTSLGALNQYYLATNTAGIGVPVIERIAKAMLKDTVKFSAEDRAFTHNQLSMALHGAAKIDEAIAEIEQAIALHEDEEAYHFNLSLLFEQKLLVKKAADEAEKAITIRRKKGKRPDVDHLSQACDVFVKANEMDKYASALEELRSVDPARAQWVLRRAEEEK